MKYIKKIFVLSKSIYVACLFLLCCMVLNIQASFTGNTGPTSQVVGSTVTATTTVDGVVYTATYQNIVCLGSRTTIAYSVVNNNPGLVVSPCPFADFVPACDQGQAPGLTHPIVIPPQPSSIDTFDSTSGPHCNNGICPNGIFPSGGVGLWNLADPFPNGITYVFTVSVRAAGCGLQYFQPCLCYTSLGTVDCFPVIAILVVPPALLPNQVTGPICQDSAGFTGTLPAPICTGSDSCDVCGGAVGPCCTGFTGSCGDYPFNYTVTSGTGGTVTLLDPTGGVYQFVPNSGFFGTGSFTYNVVSDSIPIIFCSPAPAEIDITIAQAPITTNANFSGCAGTGFTGSLYPLVSGGSGSYTFSQVGPISCGTVVVSSDGDFSYVAPTGAGTCVFVYSATDTTPPNCAGTGAVSITVNASPIPTPQELDTCVGVPVSGTLSATSGLAPYTFSLVNGPETRLMGTVVLTDSVG